MDSSHTIEKLKQEIEDYRETLSLLKMGNSIEDYLLIKSKFDELKPFIEHIHTFTKTIDDAQALHIQSLTQQIDALQQTIKHMDQQITLVLNNLTPYVPTHTETKTTTTSSAQPSYKMLQHLAGTASNRQFDLHQGVPIIDSHLNMRQTSKRYIQSTASPSHITIQDYQHDIAESSSHTNEPISIQESSIHQELVPDNPSSEQELVNNIEEEIPNVQVETKKEKSSFFLDLFKKWN
ncbi:hypothetical protein [Lysinibacillus piscis]|uniref:Uncharacterized protein n=1 Tax=Lysinibacillus piscis TaxID=2518931 RepID=A0ABQ5NMC3_9BACI|nr:hypothetical protein [Lysinibacillus sp. KH24]GLC89517.1 hypothetical protein LYSBPC_26440 [Lysinibacillus sp. KH24]